MVEDWNGRELIHDNPTHAVKDSKKPISYNISKSVARDRPYYPKGKPDGPLDQRFAMEQNFDKSVKLTKNPKVKSVPKFEQALTRNTD